MVDKIDAQNEGLNAEKKGFRVLLAPTAELAETLRDVPYSVEAEYGSAFYPGKKITYAHHGPRSGNPAPCEQPNQSGLEPGDILISHIDLDTVGGIMAIQGEKNDYRDYEFWKAAAYIDVNGPHHMHELPQKEQDKLNAYFSRVNKNERVRYSEITDVTELVNNYKNAIAKILDEQDPAHEEMIAEGKKWNEETTEKIESKLISESDKVRTFVTDGVFCGAAYYSPNKGKIIPCTLSYNQKFKSITLGFCDSSIPHSACEIMQELFGPEAGGRKGIAGSPRGQEMTLEDLEKARAYIENLL